MTSFTCFEHFGTVLTKLDEEDQGRLAAALILYGTQGIEPSLGGYLDAMFEALRNDIDNSVNAKSRNAGGRPRKASKPKVEESENGCFQEVETGVSKNENGGFSKRETGVSESAKPNISQASIGQAKVEERKGVRAKRERFSPPSLDDIKTFWQSERLRGSPDAFRDHYESCGWVIGKGKPMKDWKAAARNWSRRQSEWEGDKDAIDDRISALGTLAF